MFRKYEIPFYKTKKFIVMECMKRLGPSHGVGFYGSNSSRYRSVRKALYKLTIKELNHLRDMLLTVTEGSTSKDDPEGYGRQWSS